jgi:hypothetical protein
MAHILPESLPQTMPGEVLRVFRALKALPDTFYIWHHLAPWQKDAPDFLMITRDGRALLIKVSSASTSQVAPAAQLQLLAPDHSPPGQTENLVLGEFVRSLKLGPRQQIETLVVFPNISHKQVLASRPERPEGDPHWVGRDLVQSDSGLSWEAYLPAEALETISLEILRQRFTPEAVVPRGMTVRMRDPRRLNAGLTDYLLDYDQEAALKADLDIAAEGQALGTDFRLNIINGVAGSGKTLILLYRLRLLYHYYPNKRFLVLTHNRPLSRDLESRFSHLEGELPRNIEWRTFNGWCYHHWPQDQPWTDPLTIQQRTKLLDSVCRSHLSGSNITTSMLRSEIDWIKDQLPADLVDYLATDRRGRGFRLSAEQRRRIWSAFEAYESLLRQKKALDWGDIPRRFWSHLQDQTIPLPPYDFILIDEAQFFAPIWIAIVQRMLNPDNAHLFVVADPTQGFLGRGTSWKTLGLNARGRSHQLRHSYRTTREIMQFATLLYRSRLSDEQDEDVLAPDLFNMPSGTYPIIIALDNAQDEITRVSNEVAELIKRGEQRKNILVLHADGDGVNVLIKAINHRLGKDSAMDPKDTHPGNYVRVTTLNAGAGLESPMVFLVGLRGLFEEEQSLRLADDEREAIRRDNTRKIYMAATRAGQRLVLTYVGDLPQELKLAFRV